jgi:hypothetical protein
MWIVRPASESDLGPIYEVWYETEIDGLADPPPPSANPWFDHLLQTGRLLVATDTNGAVVGFAGSRQEQGLRILTDCFVRPTTQSKGVGRALLDRLLAGTGPLATFASSDPRAVASYLRYGMIPRWPCYYLRGGTRPRRSGAGLMVAPVPDRELRLPWLSFAAHDLGAWLERGAMQLEVHCGAKVVGAAVVAGSSQYSPFAPEGITVLTSFFGVGDPGTGLAQVVSWCLEQSDVAVNVQVPGAHPALPILVEAGFRIIATDMACLSHPDLVSDPSRTTFSGEPYAAVG